MLTSFNWADWVIVAIIVVSALISLLRGFVKEALSLLSWALAFFVAVAFHQPMVSLLESSVGKPYVRDILAYVILFAGTLVLGSLATYLISMIVKRTGLSGTDRLLGMIFGTARGVIVVLASVILLPSLLSGIQQDEWWRSSQLIPEFLLMTDWSQQTFNDLLQWASSLLASHRQGTGPCDPLKDSTASEVDGMCGIAGIVAKSNVNQDLYDALTVLQHRGQDAAGIVTFDGGRLNQRKGNGLVRDVFHTRHMQRLTGNMGIGHVRYPTAGSSSPALAQPFYVNSPYGISLAHNGNLTNSAQLTKELFQSDLRHLNTESDSEVLLNVFAHELQRLGKLVPSSDDLFAAVSGVHDRCRGGYAVVAMIANYGVIGFRDPHGIRPLVYGVRENANGKEYMLASESVALDTLGYELIGDVAPGEAVFIDMQGQIHKRQCAEKTELRPCIFEHVYFARPDSIMDGVSVYKARLRQGERLADKILREYPDHDIDVIVPIPDSSRIAAQSMASRLGVKFREGLVKNRYIGRTFIMPGQNTRKKSVRQKLNAIELEFRDKNVMLVDDSIVRGTTCQQIIEMAREAGARKVYFASASPPVRFPNVYGIDMPSAHELIANNRSVEEIQEEIGADWLLYQDLDDLLSCSAEGNSEISDFECAVFNGDYATGDVDQAYLDRLEADRNDTSQSAKNAAAGDGALIGLHNDVS